MLVNLWLIRPLRAIFILVAAAYTLNDTFLGIKIVQFGRWIKKQTQNIKYVPLFLIEYVHIGESTFLMVNNFNWNDNEITYFNSWLISNWYVDWDTIWLSKYNAQFQLIVMLIITLFKTSSKCSYSTFSRFIHVKLTHADQCCNPQV